MMVIYDENEAAIQLVEWSFDNIIFEINLYEELGVT